MEERTERDVLREALGWGLAGLAAVVVGLLIKSGGNDFGQVVAVAGGLLVALCLATAAYELVRRD